jgi:hypothetical protein
MNPTQITAAIALACFLGGFLSGYKVEDWRWTAKANAEALAVAHAAIAQRDEAVAAYTHLAGELSAKNDQHAAELRAAQNETNLLRTRVNAGSLGLRVAATCPDLSQIAPAPGSRVDTGTGAELAGTAQQAYFALRDGIDTVDAKLAACQDELRLRTE